MKVQELIEELEKHDPGATVYLCDEAGLDDRVIVSVKYGEYQPEGVIIDACRW